MALGVGTSTEIKRMRQRGEGEKVVRSPQEWLENERREKRREV